MMNRFLRDIEKSWVKNLWDWEEHFKQLRRFLEDYSEDELINAAEFLRHRNYSLYRTDIWIGAILINEGAMSESGFNYLTDCASSIPDFVFEHIIESGDSLMDYPKLVEGYAELYFLNLPLYVYDQRKKASKYEFLLLEKIKKIGSDPWDNIEPFNRAIAQSLVPNIYEKYKEEVVWYE